MTGGAGSRISFRRIAPSLVLVPLILVLAHCPLPVDEALATAVADKIAPTIAITSPRSGQTFSATVHFTGTISDDAAAAGDGMGVLKQVQYTIANDTQRRGRISIAADGTATQDPAFGTGAIAWSETTHTFDFDVSTVVPFPLQGLVTVTIDATDANGNTRSHDVQLAEGTGPFIIISNPDAQSRRYIGGSTTVNLSGIVSNAQDVQGTASNIASLSWGVTGKTWGATIPVVSGTTSYSVPNTGFSVNQQFTLDTTTGAFGTSFVVPFINDSTLIMTVTATDRNNHTVTQSIVLVEDVSGPQLTITSPTTGQYYSSSGSVGYSYTVSGNVLQSDLPTVKAVTYQVVAGTYDSGSQQVYLNPNPPGFFDAVGNFSFTIPSANFVGKTGTAQVTITIPNLNNITTTAQFTIAEDSTAPSLSSIAMTSSNASTAYAKPGDTATVTFQSSDSLSGLAAPPTVTIAGRAVTPSGPVGSTFTAQAVLLPGDPVDGSGHVPFTISASDAAGNTASTSTAGTNVTYYDGTPSLVPGSVGITSNNASPTWAKSGDTLTLSFTSQRTLSGTPTVTIDGRTAAVNSGAAPTYTATCVMQGSDTEGTLGPAGISIDFTDAAGNPGVTVTATTNGSQVTFDRTPPVISSVTFSSTPNGDNWLGIGDTITASITAGETGLVKAAAGDITINGVQTGALTDNLDGTYAATYAIMAGHTDRTSVNSIPLSVVLTDPAGNASSAYTAPPSAPKLDAHVPTISTVSFTTSTANAGGWIGKADTITANITAGSSETGLLRAAAADITINTVQTGALTDNGNGTYSATYAISEGDADRTTVNTVPVHVVLTDPADNASTAFNSSSLTAPKLDAHAPTITSVALASSNADPTWAKAGDAITITINLGASESSAMTDGTITVNNVATTGFSTSAGSTRIATYTVGGGDANWLQNQQIPVSVVVIDRADNPSATFTTSPAPGLGIDTIAPTISSATFASTPNGDNWLGIGDTITASITAGETGLVKAAAGDITINGVQTGALTDNLDGTYAATYAIMAGHTDRTSVNSIPLSVVLTDPAGNASSAYTAPPSAPKLDAHVPTISTVSFTTSTANAGGWIGKADTITANITAGSSETGLLRAAAADITINTVQTGALTDNGNGTYSATYAISEGDADRTTVNTVPVHVVLTDPADNASTAFNSSSLTAPKLDAHAPTITSIGLASSNADPTWAKAGDTVTLTITLGASETGLTPGTITVNSVATAGLIGSGSSRTTAYTVGSGDANWLQSQQIPVSVVVIDRADNPSATFTTSPAAGLGIDTIAPTIGSVQIDANAAHALVTFTEGVYRSNLTGALQDGSMTFADQSNGSKTTTAVTVAHSAGALTATYTLTWTAAPAQNDVIVATTVAGSIYDAAGNENLGGDTGSDTAKFLRMFGARLSAAGSVQKASGPAGVVFPRFQAPVDRSPAGGTAGITAIAEPGGPGELPATDALRTAQFFSSGAATRVQPPPFSWFAPASGRSAPASGVSAKGARSAGQERATPPGTSFPAALQAASAHRGSASPTVLPPAAPALEPLPAQERTPAWWKIAGGLVAAAFAAAAAWWVIRFAKVRWDRG